MSEQVRLGVIGVGNMGLGHIRNAAEGKMPEISITCVADIDETKFALAKEIHLALQLEVRVFKVGDPALHRVYFAYKPIIVWFH